MPVKQPTPTQLLRDWYCPPHPLGPPEQTSGLAKNGGGIFQAISRMYVLYKPAKSYPCMLSPSLIFFPSISILIQTRPYYAGVAQIQKDKDSPYLIDFMVEDLLCQALNQACILQGMQGSISSLGAGEASHQMWDGLSSK